MSASKTRAQLEFERQFRIVVEGTDDLVTKVDAQGRFQYVNHSAERFLGLRPEECIGLDAFSILHPADREQARATYHELVTRRGHVATFDNRTISRTGEVFQMIWTTNAHYDEEGSFIGAWSIARDITYRDALDKADRRHLESQAQLAVERARAEFRREVLRRSIAAQEAERRRIAHEVYQEAARILSRMNVRLQRIQDSEYVAVAATEARAAQTDLVGAVVEIQRVVERLRPAALDELGLAAALEELVQDASATLPVSLTQDRLPGLDPAAETAIYRVIQEALLNALRHAQPRSVRVWLTLRNRSINAVVDDDGRGFDPALIDASAYGISAMRERADAVGGRLDIETEPGSGTRIRLVIPVDDTVADDCGHLTVLVAGEQPLSRTGMCRLIEGSEDIEVVGEASDAREMQSKVRAHHPAVVVLDPDGWPDGCAQEAIESANVASRRARVVVVTSIDEASTVRELLRAGASGYVLKSADAHNLIEAIRQAANGETYLQPQLGARLSQHPDGADDPCSDLTRREVEVLRLLALGHTNQEIANELFLSVRTVEAHRTRIQQKLHVASRAELVRFALETRILRA